MPKLIPPLTLSLLAIFLVSCNAEEPTQPETSEKPVAAAQGLLGKVFCGYQGWYRTPGDGTGMGWSHYETYQREFHPGQSGIEYWPDMSEMDPDEHYETPFKKCNGEPATVFSSAHPKTVNRHFRWMKDYGIDGIFLQRFVVEVTGDNKDSILKRSIDLVLENCQKGAQNNGRSYGLMYDLSGAKPHHVAQILADWRELNAKYDLAGDPHYLKHNGKPLLSFWGVGFNDGRRYNTQHVRELIEAFRAEETQYSILLGVPTYWREGINDSVPTEELHPVLKMTDVVLPWKVNRPSFSTPEAVMDAGKALIEPDYAWCQQNDMAYLPVAFPGFSWANRKNKPADFNETPRLNGRLLWTQAVSAKQAGADSLYVAMFDEMDEGTQIFKVTNLPPVGATKFLTHEKGLASDHYLRLTGAIGRLMKGEIPAEYTAPKF